MKKIYYAIAVLIIFLSACKKESSIKEDQHETPGKTITYHLKNGGEVTVAINKKGEYVVGGDVILSKDQIAYLEYNKVGDGKETTPRSTFTGEYQKLWPGGIIYYVINDASHSSDILNAMSDWEASTPIRFVQRTNQANYVNFQGAPSNGGGDSQLGMVGGQQLIRLSAGADKSTAIHEIGHAVGLMHEQTRTDRDQYININYNNISTASWKAQYDRYDVQGRQGGQFGTFDFNSIMLYRSYASEVGYPGNSSPQITRKDGSTWGDNYSLSQGDIEGVNYLYLKNPNGLVCARIEVDNLQLYPNDAQFQEKGDFYIAFYTDYTYTTRVVPSASISFKYRSRFNIANYFGGGDLDCPQCPVEYTVSNINSLNRIYIGTNYYRGSRELEDPQWGYFTEYYTNDYYVISASGYNPQLEYLAHLVSP